MTKLWALSLLLSATLAHGASRIVINEIMYHPPGELDDLQFVELFNAGTDPVNLKGWKLDKPIQLELPAMTIAPGGFVVVCNNKAVFAARYRGAISAVGNFKSPLKHHSGTVQLSDPTGTVVDAAAYSDSAPWPKSPDGHSTSLERISPYQSGTNAANWASSRLPLYVSAAGTPGRRNDRFQTNVPPGMAEIKFTPAQPKPGEPVTVTVAAQDPAGVTEVFLTYRGVNPPAGTPTLTPKGTNSEGPEVKLPMRRISGDAQNGIYSAQIENSMLPRLVRFKAHALNANNAERVMPDPEDIHPAFSYFSFANTNHARVPFIFVFNTSGTSAQQGRYVMQKPIGNEQPETTRGNGVFVHVDPNDGAVDLRDFVAIQPRSGGFKVHFGRNKPFRDMATINVIFENSPRWVVAEPLAYELYTMAGVPAEKTEHARVWLNGKVLGYYLVIEQPTRMFMERQDLKTVGNMYKLLWYGSDVIQKHEQKWGAVTNHADLMEAIRKLDALRGDAQWQYIQQNFDVNEWVNYYAVNMCIENWDGFFNNYFIHHDTTKNGKWVIFPWDEDKTWGDFDGAPAEYDWYEMPITFGMTGDRSPPIDPRSRANRESGPFDGVVWWRPPGYFSGPLLANKEFRKLFLNRIKELCEGPFTPAIFNPRIDAMEKRLEEEVSVRAVMNQTDPRSALNEFHRHMQSFRNQVQNRRAFLLKEVAKEMR